MHALTRSTSGMYAWQSRIASGSQAARCSGVHCCAAAGEDANVSARPRSAVESEVESAAATIGQSFACAIRISIIDPPVGVLPRYLPSIQRAWQAALACCGERLRDRGTAQLENSVPMADGQLLGREQRDHAATLVGHHDLLFDAGGGVAVARRAIGFEREHHALLDFGRMVERDHA